MTNCTVSGCPGHYDATSVTHTVRHRGELLIIDHVPAEQCSVCGDVLFTPDTIRRIEKLLQTHGAPVRNVPLFEFA